MVIKNPQHVSTLNGHLQMVLFKFSKITYMTSNLYIGIFMLFIFWCDRYLSLRWHIFNSISLKIKLSFKGILILVRVFITCNPLNLHINIRHIFVVQLIILFLVFALRYFALRCKHKCGALRYFLVPQTKTERMPSSRIYRHQMRMCPSLEEHLRLQNDTRNTSGVNTETLSVCWQTPALGKLTLYTNKYN